MNSASPIAATGFVMALPDRVRADLLARGQTRHFDRGQIIQQRGDPAREFWYVESGSVQIGRYGIDGRLTLFALIGAGVDVQDDRVAGGAGAVHVDGNDPIGG